MAYGYRNLKAELAGVVGAILVPYLGASLAKATGKPLTAALVTTGTGVAALLAKPSMGVRSASMDAFLGGAGYGGVGYAGPWLAANTPTLGGKAAGPIPLQDVASSAAAQRIINAARAKASRGGAAGGARAGQRAGLVQPLPEQKNPQGPTQTYFPTSAEANNEDVA